MLIEPISTIKSRLTALWADEDGVEPIEYILLMAIVGALTFALIVDVHHAMLNLLDGVFTWLFGGA